MKHLSEYIYEKYHHNGTKSMKFSIIVDKLKSVGVYSYNAKDDPDLLNMCKGLSFAEEIDYRLPYNIQLHFPEQYLSFDSKNKGRDRIYFIEMQRDSRGTNQDLMDILMYLRRKVFLIDEEYSKYGNHPELNKVKDVVLNQFEKILNTYNKKNKTSYSIQLNDYEYKSPQPNNSYKNGNGYCIEIVRPTIVSGSNIGKTIGIFSMWEDVLGCLHFSYTRGGVWDGSEEEYIKWNISDVKKKIESFISKSINSDM